MNLLNIKPKLYCRLEIPKSLDIGVNAAKTGIKQALNELSKSEEGKRYFIVRMPTKDRLDIDFRLVEDNSFDHQEHISSFDLVNEWDDNDPNAEMPLQAFMCQKVKSTYASLKEKNIATIKEWEGTKVKIIKSVFGQRGVKFYNKYLAYKIKE